MTWEEKLLAMRALGGMETALHVRSKGDWYVRVPGVEIKDKAVLRSLSGNGKTPKAAVEDCWNNLAGRTLVTKASGPDRALYLWSGFMWARQDEVA